MEQNFLNVKYVQIFSLSPLGEWARIIWSPLLDIETEECIISIAKFESVFPYLSIEVLWKYRSTVITTAKFYTFGADNSSHVFSDLILP